MPGFKRIKTRYIIINAAKKQIYQSEVYYLCRLRGLEVLMLKRCRMKRAELFKIVNCGRKLETVVVSLEGREWDKMGEKRLVLMREEARKKKQKRQSETLVS